MKMREYVGEVSDPARFEIPMSLYNRIQDPTLESIALICAKRGEAVVIEDEPDTRKYKAYSSLLPFTIDILKMIRSNVATSRTMFAP
jgi:hypothetical protein